MQKISTTLVLEPEVTAVFTIEQKKKQVKYAFQIQNFKYKNLPGSGSRIYTFFDKKKIKEKCVVFIRRSV